MNMTNQLSITLDDDSIELLDKLHTITSMKPAAIIAKLFPAHLEELWTYLTWLDQLPPGPSELRDAAIALIQNYGPTTLIDDLKTLDPGYQTEGELFEQSLSRKVEA